MIRAMSESKAAILGCSGLSLTDEEAAFFAAHRPWGFILFARNVGDLDQLRRLVSDLRQSVARDDAPVLVDQEGGRVQRLRPPLAERYPSAAQLGEIYLRDHVAGRRAAWLMSRLHAFDLARCGISVDCLPVLDVPAGDSSNVIGDRAYGADPHVVADMGAAAAAGLKAGGLLPVIKHMPGHGRARVDTHLELAVVDAPREALEDVDFVPFRALRKEAMAMTAHVVYSAIDARSPGHDVVAGRQGRHSRGHRLRRAPDVGRHIDEGAFGGFFRAGGGNPFRRMRHGAALQRRHVRDAGRRRGGAGAGRRRQAPGRCGDGGLHARRTRRTRQNCAGNSGNLWPEIEATVSET